MSELTMDQAVELLDAPPVADESAPASEVEDTQDSPGTTGEGVGEAAQPGDDASEAEEAPADEDASEVEAPPVPAPQWWDAEAKAHFAELTPEAQKIVLEQENKREAITAKVKQEAQTARQEAIQRIQGLSVLQERLAESLDFAEQGFQSRWDGWTPEVWAELANQDPGQYVQYKAAFDLEMTQLTRAREVKAQSEAVAQQAHFEAQRQKLQQAAPELYNSPDDLREVGSLLIDVGYTPDVIAQATAEDLMFAHKANQWRKKAEAWDAAQAGAKKSAEAPPQTAKNPPARMVAPVASSNPGNAQQREIQRLENRLAQTKSFEDGVALLEARARAASR